jgi:hypothetical protein
MRRLTVPHLLILLPLVIVSSMMAVWFTHETPLSLRTSLVALSGDQTDDIRHLRSELEAVRSEVSRLKRRFWQEPLDPTWTTARGSF